MSTLTDNTQSLLHGLHERLLSLVVTHVRVTFTAPEYGVNEFAHLFTHSILYLLTTDGKSVEINMGSPSADTYLGRLMIRRRHFQSHRHAFKHWDFLASTGLLVPSQRSRVPTLGANSDIRVLGTWLH
ncbi:unnamed protein product [Penicillium manginii]